MKKLVIFMTLALAMSTVALANPVFQDRGAKASNVIYQSNAAEGDDRPVRKKPGRTTFSDIKLQTWNDPDSDGDGILTLVSTEIIDSNQGQIVSAIKSERPKFKAGAELSKTIRDVEPTTPKLLCLCSWDLGIADLDGDGTPDIVIGADRNGETVTVVGTEIDKKDIKKGFIKTESHMNKAELIEQMASEAGLSKEESAGVLDAFINATTKASGKR